MARKTKDQVAGKLILSLVVGLGAFGLTLFFFISVGPVYAVVDSSDISFAVNGASTFYMDSNKFCGDVEGPDGMWLPIAVTNMHSTDTATGLELIFTAPLSTTSDDTTRYIGNLGSGESVDVFFFVDYSALRADLDCDEVSDDGQWYVEGYTVTLRSIDGSGSLNGDAIFNTDTFSTTSMISANAGGARFADLMGPGATTGQVITQSVIYDFGNNGGDNDLFFQPTGNGATFSDACFRLIGSEITQSDITGVNVGAMDQLFFPGLSSSNNDKVTIEYQWLVLCSPGTTTQTFAWAEMTSGTQYKYAGGSYGPTEFPLPNPVTGQVSITKTVQVPSNFSFFTDDSVAVTYTVQIANVYTMPVVLSTIADRLDTNMSFIDETGTSYISDTNSSVSPAGNDTGLLDWFGMPPDNSYIIPAQGSVDLIYQVLIDYDDASLDPQVFTNTVTATIGSETLGPVSTIVILSPSSVTSVGLLAFGIGSSVAPSSWLIFGMVALGLVTAVIYIWQRKQAQTF